MNVTHVFSGVPVSDLPRAEEFYEALFDRPLHMRPNDSEVVWQLADRALVYVVVDAARAGHGLLTLIVDDLEATIARLADRAIVAGPSEPVGGGRKAIVVDPDGNQIALAQVPGAA